ncbi:MAG: diterpene synthase [Chloroflexi bacterium]|nr:diterpene synthase [Chloroflexota bacterium]
MNLSSFLSLPTAEVATLVREHGPHVCVFPINGTRRWFILEYPYEAQSDFSTQYLVLSGRRHIALYQMLFDHGVETLVTPIFGPDLLERGEEYRQMMESALVWFARDADFLSFYDQYDVRVHVYGDAERYLAGTPYAGALEAYRELADRTASHRHCRLFFGVCGHDPTERVASFAVAFHQQTGRAPTRREIIAHYYGEYIDPVDLFIGFDRPAAFDMPLIATGSEDLYFMVSPSPYLDERTLRTILFDHAYTRRVPEDYSEFSPADWSAMRRFYAAHRHSVLGIGDQYDGGKFWYPTVQVFSAPDALNAPRADGNQSTE